MNHEPQSVGDPVPHWLEVSVTWIRVALAMLRIEACRPLAWLVALGVCVLSPWSQWLGAHSLGLSGLETDDVFVVGMLIGLYWGCSASSSAVFLAQRMSSLQRVGVRWVLLSASMAVTGACTLAGARWVASGNNAMQGSSWPEWALSTLLLTALGIALLPWFTSPGRCFLAVVTIAWWIPAVLPPSFLVAVPRALRGAFEGGGALALPSEPVGWLADTALAAGLLLLAWAPRSPTFRGDEVRHPG